MDYIKGLEIASTKEDIQKIANSFFYWFPKDYYLKEMGEPNGPKLFFVMFFEEKCDFAITLNYMNFNSIFYEVLKVKCNIFHAPVNLQESVKHLLNLLQIEIYKDGLDVFMKSAILKKEYNNKLLEELFNKGVVIKAW